MQICERKQRYAEKLVTGACETIRAAQSGERNNTVNEQAFYVGRKSQELGLDDNEIICKLTGAAVDVGLARSAAEKTARSGYHSGQGNPLTGFLDQESKPSRQAPTPKPPATKKPGKIHATRQAAIDAATWSVRQDHADVTLTESYEYQFADGTLAHETLRFEFNENGQTDKTIRHITPVFGGFVVGMNGVSSGIPLFNLPAISSLAPGCDILKVEGEKTHRATVRMGYYATTSIGGSASGWASKSDWSPLKGHHVVIIPDNDGPGEKHAGEVVRLATGAGAASVLIVRMPDIWPDAGPGDDIADLEEAVGEERARQMIDEAIERARIGSVEPVTQPVKPQTGTARLVEHTLRDIVSRAVDWLWKNRFAKSTISIIEGDPGQGKSFITLDIAARVSQGFAMPPAPRGDVVLKPRHVILVSAEDGIDTTIKPRLVAMGANEDHVTCIETVLDNPDDPDSIRPVCFPRDLSLLEECIHRKQAAMVVIDPLSAVLTEKADSNKEADMRRVLHQLKLMAERTGVAIVIVRHLNKMSTETNAMYRGGGSIGIIGAARSAFVVGAHPDDEVGDRRILARVKGNLCATPPSLEYRVEVQDGVPVVHWEGEVDITAHELSAKSVSNKDEKRSKAKDFLLEKLAMGEVAADVLEEQARGIGISISTLRRAKNDLGISSRRLEFKGGWMWSLSQ